MTSPVAEETFSHVRGQQPDGSPLTSEQVALLARMNDGYASVWWVSEHLGWSYEDVQISAWGELRQ